MIERFNFYDIYGYLIPGVVMTMLLLIPYGITTSHWPDTKLASIAIVLVAAYVVGQFIQSMASGAVSSKVARDRNGNAGYPSVLMLNPSNKALAMPLRLRLVELVAARFKMTLDVSTEVLLDVEVHKEIARERNNAFFLCRPIANEASNYGEQFQGLYVLMRGLFVGLLLGCCYHVGWLLYFLRSADVKYDFQVILGISFVASLALALWRAFDTHNLYETIDYAALLVLGLLLMMGGEIVAEVAKPKPTSIYLLLAIAGALPIAAFRFYALYRYFANEFAKAIWTYFAVSEPASAKAGSQ